MKSKQVFEVNYSNNDLFLDHSSHHVALTSIPFSAFLHLLLSLNVSQSVINNREVNIRRQTRHYNTILNHPKLSYTIIGKSPRSHITTFSIISMGFKKLFILYIYRRIDHLIFKTIIQEGWKDTYQINDFPKFIVIIVPINKN